MRKVTGEQGTIIADSPSNASPPGIDESTLAEWGLYNSDDYTSRGFSVSPGTSEYSGSAGS